MRIELKPYEIKIVNGYEIKNESDVTIRLRIEPPRRLDVSRPKKCVDTNETPDVD